MAMRMMLYDRLWRRVGAVESVTAMSGVTVCNGVSSLSFDVDNNVQYVDVLTTPGAKVELYSDNQFIEAFRVVEYTTALPDRTGKVAVRCAGFNDLTARLLGYPQPTRTLPANTTSQFTTDYDNRTGPFETVAKGLILDAATRIGEPVTVTASQGRGPQWTASVRCHNLADVLSQAADKAGMNITVTPNAGHNGYLVDVTPRVMLPLTIAEQSQLIVGGKAIIREPKATRVIVGGQGEKTARVFYPALAPDLRESDWGVRREVFRDARDATDAAVLAKRAEETLSEGAPQYEVHLELAESEGFRWRAGYNVGDAVRVKIRGVLITDWIRRVEWSWGHDRGLVATPIVGEPKGDATYAFAYALAAIQRRDRAGKAGT